MGGTWRRACWTDNQHDQTASIADGCLHPVVTAWTGAGHPEGAIAHRSSQPPSKTPEHGRTTSTNADLGPMSQTNGNGTTCYAHDPSGLPISERKGTTGNYYLFDGRGNVVALEDPGTIQAAYDYCPTGNNAALPGTQLTTVGLNNPLRQGGVPYDDGTKDYFNGIGCIVEDASGVCTQTAGQQYLNVPVGSNSVAYSPLLASSSTSRSGEPSNLVAQAGLTPSHPCINTNNPRFSGGLFEAGEGATQAGGGILVIGTPADPLGWAILAFGLYHVANGIVVATTSC